MKSFNASAFFLLVVCGCGGEALSPNDAARPTAPDEGAQPAARAATGAASLANARPVPEAPTPTISDADRPKSIEEFKSQFLRYYKEDMYAPFIELAYWGSSTNEQKKEYLARVRSVFMEHPTGEPAAVRSPSDIEVMSLAEYSEETGGVGAALTAGGGEIVPLNPEPTHVLQITGHVMGPDEGSAEVEETVSYDFAVGLYDGKYYFCTIKRK